MDQLLPHAQHPSMQEKRRKNIRIVRSISVHPTQFVTDCKEQTFCSEI